MCGYSASYSSRRRCRGRYLGVRTEGYRRRGTGWRRYGVRFKRVKVGSADR